jgi:dienelactone hydrolase
MQSRSHGFSAKRFLSALGAICLMFAGFAGAARADGGEEFAPPSGKGRLVVVISGQSGSAHYRPVAQQIAALGYDVVLYDGNPMEGTHGQGLKSAIADAMQMPHALPGKIGLVGFSLGGAMVLGFGSGWGDQVAVVAAWYPATSPISDPAKLAARMNVPVVMFAGEADTYKSCCLIGKAHDIADAAKAANAKFDLTTYPGVNHDFVVDGSHYDPDAFKDAFAKTQAALAQYLGQPQ